ncbi:MAG: hypothetical protein ACE5FA_09705 [Dehalococcoidia bacterium]
MQQRFRPTRVPLLLATVFAAMAAAGCGDDEILGHDENEPNPNGLTIQVAGQTVTVANGAVQGSISVAAGTETANFDIVFTLDGQALNPDADFFLVGESADTTIAEFHLVSPFHGHIEGHAAGSTSVVFKFMHPPGPDAHSNFDSPPIPITVTP